MLRRLNDAMTQRVTRIQSWYRDKIDRGSKLRTNVIVDKYNKPSIAIVPEFFGTDYVTRRTNAMHTCTEAWSNRLNPIKPSLRIKHENYELSWPCT